MSAPETVAAADILSPAEALELACAVDLLKAIAARATEASWDAPRATIAGEAAPATYLGRLAGECDLTQSALFSVLCTASSYCRSSSAAAAIDARKAARNAGQVSS